jgi:hypothetical protein
MQWEQLDADIALLHVEFVVAGSDRWFNRFKWREPPVEPFERIRVVGYGHGMYRVDDRESLVVRAFQGHVVSRLDEFKPVGRAGSAFPVYELRSRMPRGLSGAPLLNSQGAVFVHGVVIGNRAGACRCNRKFDRGSESRPPVTRPSSSVSHSQDFDFVPAEPVDQGKGKSCKDVSSGPVSKSRPRAGTVRNSADRLT